MDDNHLEKISLAIAPKEYIIHTLRIFYELQKSIARMN